MRDYGDHLSFSPRLPAHLGRVAFRLSYRGRCLQVDVRRDGVRYELQAGEPLEIQHDGRPVVVARDEPQMRPLPDVPHRPAPSAPPGREPYSRHRAI
jgi:alpha,alpha-trehalose phosphorylase